MATLEINGKRVEVDDSFRSLSPEEQQITVDEIAAQMGIVGQPPEEQGGFRLGGLYENIVGEGAVDTPGEMFGEALKAGGAGLMRGLIGTAELPEMVGRGAIRLGQEAGQALGYDLPDTAVMDTGTGRALRGAVGMAGMGDDLNFKGTSTPAQYAGTVAEFLGGGGALGAAGKIAKASNLGKLQQVGSAAERIGLGREAVKGATIAAVGSEAAGQATEGTAFEPAARLIGAFAAPTVANKTVNLFSKRAATRPSVENLQSYKTAAYNAADASGVKFAAPEVDGLIARATAKLDDFNFDPDVDLQTKAALKSLTNKAGSELTLGQLDKIRKGLSARYSRSQKEPGILGLIDEIDDLIDTSPLGGELMTAARTANRKFKKAELLDLAFTKATDDAGLSGNVVDNFRRAVKNVINSPQARSFSPEEIEVMRRFVRGELPENALRLIGKLSPSSSSLMAALNIGAVATNPAMVGISLAGAGAKAGAERSGLKAIEEIKDMVANSTIPEAKKLVTDQQIRTLLGLQAE